VRRAVSAGAAAWPRVLAGAALLIALLLLLSGCGPDPRQVALCERILPALVDPAERASALVATAEAGEAHAVRLQFQTAAGAERQIVCVFGGNALSPERLSLYRVILDGTPLSFAQMVFLWRAFDLLPPTKLVAEDSRPPPMAPPRAAAYLLQQLVNGLTLGAVFALIAVGYSLVYGVTGTIQFAFGEVFMIGAYLMIVLLAALTAAGLGWLPAVLLLTLAGAGGFAAAHGFAIERLVYRPLRGGGTFAPLVAAIGLSIALREYVRLAQSGSNKWLPNLLPGRMLLWEGGGFPVTVSATQIFIVLLALAIGAALAWLVLRTRFGRAQRACADDPVMAALLGIDVNGTVAGAFMLGAVLAALAGLVVALYYGEVDPFMGYLAGFKALTAALLGGFGSISGAMAGGLLLGLFEALWAGYFGGLYKDAAVFTVLILVLVFRPQGLLGTASRPRDAGDLSPAR